jgi:hypothetical protein
MGADRKSSWRASLVIVLVVVALPILIPALLIWLLISFALKLLLLVVAWSAWTPQGKEMLIVYSNSPYWKEFFEAALIPELEARALILNWSERSEWRRFDLRTLIFRSFVGRRSFNPMVLVVRPFRWPKSFRFYDAFKQFKHGKEQQLNNLVDALRTYLAKT